MAQVLDGIDQKQAIFQIKHQEPRSYIKPGDHDDNILFDDKYYSLREAFRVTAVSQYN